MTASKAVLVMAKRPQPGSTKTRLVPPLTAQEAADLYECFLMDALEHARSTPSAVPVVAVWPPEATTYFATIAPDFSQVIQRGDSLDVRLDHALTECLDRGFDHVVAINSDSPTLPHTFIADAFTSLADDEVDMVLGPADDGGYYLIGWKRAYPELVRGIEMSTPHVLDDTLALADRSGVRVSLLRPWYDVDDAADLGRLVLEFGQPGDRGFHSRKFLAATHVGKA